MKPRDWFGVGIRLLGVWMLLSAIDNIRTFSDILLHFFNPQYSLSLYVIRA